MMVFVPLAHASAVQLRSGVDLGSVVGCRPTPSLFADLGRDASEEEADYAALNYAGILALTVADDPRRLVLAAAVEDSQVGDRRTPFGQVDVLGLRWSQVTSLFADEAGGLDAVASARAAAGPDLERTLTDPAVVALLDGLDLLWFATDELDDLAVAD